MDWSRPSSSRTPISNGPSPSFHNASQERIPSPASQQMSMAERFEDEKRRIIGSCFARTDEQGKLLTSYITHVRVIEDASSPSAPPALNSAPSNRKPRVIIVAVKSTGRVHLYKARENDNGQFQVGKEWDLDQLQQIESFANAKPITPEELTRAQRGGVTGFIVTMVKPYYWQANSTKEKVFFLASLVKIFRKYTQGRIPELVGFDQKEIDTMLKAPNSSPSINNAPSPDPSRQPLAPPITSAQSRRYDGHSDNASISSIPSERFPAALQTDVPRSTDGGYASPKSSASNHERRFGSRDRPGFVSQQSQDSSTSRNFSPDPSKSIPRTNDNLKPQLPNSNLLQPSSTTSHQQVIPGVSNMTPKPSNIQSREISTSTQNNTEIKSATASALAKEPGFFDGTPLSTSTDKWKSKANGITSRSIPEPLAPHRQNESTTAPSRIAAVNEAAISPLSPLPERKRPPLQESEKAIPSPLPPQSLRTRLDKAAVASSPADSQLTLPKEINGRDASQLQLPVPAPSSTSSVQLPREKSPAPVSDTASFDTALEKTHTNESASSRDVGAPDMGASTESLPETPEERYRPGLGPMVKRPAASETANKFRKAANAYRAFQPRAGSALNKVLASKSTGTSEPDGISGVVPAPLQREISQDSIQKSEPPMSAKSEAPSAISEVPAVTISSPLSPGAGSVQQDRSLDNAVTLSSPAPPATTQSLEPEADKSPPVIPPRSRTRKRKSDRYAKGLIALEIDPTIFGIRGLEFESLLMDLGWDDDPSNSKKVETLEVDIKREIAKSEAGAWVGNIDHKDERIETVEKMLDKAIAECEQLDGLLTLYGVELGTLNDDVAYIEAQSHGLQVQTANQKQLHSELQNLVKTISISPREMEPLRQSSLGDLEGLQAIESCLRGLYKVLGSRRANSANAGDTQLSSMRALQDKKELCMRETNTFLDRMLKYMDPTFGAAAMKTKDALSRPRANKLKLDISAHDAGRTTLWKFSPLMLFAREIDLETWESTMRIYQARMRPVYHDEFRENVIAWKARARKSNGEEQEALFTAQEKEPEGLTSTARKITVKRSQTLAKSFRTSSSEKSSSIRNQDSKCFPYEIFQGVMDAIAPLITTEQNFVIDFFHASSVENIDFNDAVLSAPPSERRGTNLLISRVPEPDRTMSKRVLDVTEEIFSFWQGEMQILSDWATNMDKIQSLGIICVLERKIIEVEDTNQEYLLRTLQRMRERVSQVFSRFIDEQIRAIEDTKVKIKKRKGVIAFMKVFPIFSSMMEALVHPFDGPEQVPIRARLDDVYEKINKAMFDSLKVIAKESPTVMMSQNQGQSYGLSGGADPEDKEALNYHILLLENMYHYYNEVEERGDGVLGQWRAQAVREIAEHEELYVSAIIRRPLGKLLDFVESMELLMSTSPGSSQPSSIPTASSSHSRSVFKKVLSSNDAKEIRKGVDRLKERVDKHLSGADDPSISEKLIGVVLKECERRYNSVHDRLHTIAKEVYEDSLEVEFKKEDIAQAFRR